jgi:hypothetical protein
VLLDVMDLYNMCMTNSFVCGLASVLCTQMECMQTHIQMHLSCPNYTDEMPME